MIKDKVRIRFPRSPIENRYLALREIRLENDENFKISVFKSRVSPIHQISKYFVMLKNLEQILNELSVRKSFWIHLKVLFSSFRKVVLKKSILNNPFDPKILKTKVFYNKTSKYRS
jgi:hypothetical protein